MKKRSILLSLVVLCGLCVSASAEDQIPIPTAENMAAKRALLGKIKGPSNIVLIFADDLGYADTGVYGSETIPTPHIDALAKRGVRFTDAYVTAATCSPSRAGLMSGQYQQRFGFEFNTAGAAITHRERRGLDPSLITFPKVLQHAGYATGMFGKWHLGTRNHFHPNARGFDEFYGFLAGAHGYFPLTKEERVHSTVMRNNTPLKEPEYLTDAFARETVSQPKAWLRMQRKLTGWKWSMIEPERSTADSSPPTPDCGSGTREVGKQLQKT